ALVEDGDGGGTGSRESVQFMGYAAQLVWDLHHQVSLRHPKMGELIAFRRVFSRIPYDSAVDEASIEPLIIGQGLRLHYARAAVVRNRGPETVGDFVKQRRRIFAGHLYVKETLGYRVSTMSTPRLAWLFLKNCKLNPIHIGTRSSVSNSGSSSNLGHSRSTRATGSRLTRGRKA